MSGAIKWGGWIAAVIVTAGAAWFFRSLLKGWDEAWGFA